MPLLAATTTTGDLVGCVVILAVTFVVAEIVDRLLRSRAGGITHMLALKLPSADETRLRIARRLIVVAIVFVGVMVALTRLPQVDTLARGLLASAGITAIIVGFAARSVLANFVAGIIVALAQPVRIGDDVAIDEWHGVVEEVGLTYSYIRADDNSRVVIPNEQLASKVIRNFTIVDEATAAHVEFEVPVTVPLGEVRRLALEAAAAVSRGRSPGRQPTLAVTELGQETVKLRLTIWQEDRAAADQAAAALRFVLAGRLDAAGLAAGAEAPAASAPAAPPPGDADAAPSPAAERQTDAAGQPPDGRPASGPAAS